MLRVPWRQGCASEEVTTPESLTLWVMTNVSTSQGEYEAAICICSRSAGREACQLAAACKACLLNKIQVAEL